MEAENLFLETPRLSIVRPWSGDLDDWIKLYAHIPQKSHYSPAVIQQWLDHDISHFRKHGFSMASVYKKSTGSFIGRAGLVYFDYNDQQPDIELGYDLVPAYWGKGYATELAKELVQWGFSNLLVNRIMAVTKPSNISSQRVLEKAGMQQIKTMEFKGENFLFYAIKYFQPTK